MPLVGACQDPESSEAQFHPSTSALTVPPPKEVLRLPKKAGASSELPYKTFLDDDIPFYAVVGNHDDPNQPNYEAFHMGGTATSGRSRLASAQSNLEVVPSGTCGTN